VISADRPLSRATLRALDSGYDHPAGKVYAPMGATHALIRRGYTRDRVNTIGVGFGDPVTSTITQLGRRFIEAQRAAGAIPGQVRPETPPPSWEVFEPCETCGQDTGQPCLDQRPFALATGTPGPLSKPHRRRRQLGSRARRAQ
jgi:hypothetical protein